MRTRPGGGGAANLDTCGQGGGVENGKKCGRPLWIHPYSYKGFVVCNHKLLNNYFYRGKSGFDFEHDYCLSGKK